MATEDIARDGNGIARAETPTATATEYIAKDEEATATDKPFTAGAERLAALDTILAAAAGKPLSTIFTRAQMSMTSSSSYRGVGRLGGRLEGRDALIPSPRRRLPANVERLTARAPQKAAPNPAT